jgi:hypothetical protein
MQETICKRIYAIYNFKTQNSKFKSQGNFDEKVFEPGTWNLEFGTWNLDPGPSTS